MFVKKYITKAQDYIAVNFHPDKITDDPVKFCVRKPDNGDFCDVKFKISTKENNTKSTVKDTGKSYSRENISTILKNSSHIPMNQIMENLDKNINPTFVEGLIEYMIKKQMQGTKLYKNAQIDKRLFSKIISDMEYKPSKDTAIALLLALKLSKTEADELLSRAGYILSHSNKRDVIIEFFFVEGIYNLIQCNEILHKLGQKIIGRI